MHFALFYGKKLNIFRIFSEYALKNLLSPGCQQKLNSEFVKRVGILTTGKKTKSFRLNE